MNIVAFGCSFTLGQSLEDLDSHKVSKLAWPQKLADAVGCTVDNLADKGASNKFILYKLLNHEFTQDDIVIVCWSFIDRWCIIQKDDVHQFGIWNTTNLNKRYSKTLPITKTATAFYEHIHDDEDRIQEMQRGIEFSRLYLDSKGIKNYHMSVTQSLVLDNPKSWFKTKILDVNWKKLKAGQEPGLDGLHPGIKAHQIVAEKVFELTQGLTI
tara:strand:- start:685 stop:1320 length:636 start_codon:yes stop_codon:yes gene_type:complete